MPVVIDTFVIVVDVPPRYDGESRFFPKTFCALALGSLSLAACGQTTTPVEPLAGGLSVSGARGPKAATGNYLDQVNARLADEGAPIRIAYAEYVTGGPDARAAGQTIFANDRELRFPSRWVLFDPVRGRRGLLRGGHHQSRVPPRRALRPGARAGRI